jgi:peptidoglycan/xylan/chitin deacetylase (PgdA/CDA1 family)
MVKKNRFFGMIAILGTISFILLASISLTLAIQTTQQFSELPLLQSFKKKNSPDVYYITETNNILPTNDKPEYDIFTTQERQERHLATALKVSEPFYGSKVVYLTFDDGPSPENTQSVLAILKENNIKATFFLVGTEIEKYPDTLKQIYTEGHAIGSHSYNHVYRDLYQSAKSYISQLHRSDTVIKNIINVRPRISRAPGGAAGNFTTTYWNVLNEEGYIEVGWNIISGDASTAKAETILNNIIYQTNKNTFLWSHAIVLMHDGRGHAETVKALPNIIKFYKEQGFEFRVINSKTPSAW